MANLWNLETLKFAFIVLNAVVTAIISVAMWILSKHKANASRIDLLEQRHSVVNNTVNTRLTKIETTLENMPNRESVGKIHKRLDDQAKTLHTMEGQLKGLNDTSAMILQALINKGEKQQ